MKLDNGELISETTTLVPSPITRLDQEIRGELCYLLICSDGSFFPAC